MSPFTAALFREGLLDYNLQLNNYETEFEPPAKLKHIPDPTGYEIWKAKYIFKCGQPRPSEALPSDDLIEGLRKSFDNKDLLRLELDVSRAFKKRNIQQAYFNMADLRAIRIKRYYFSRMSPTLDKFSQWYKGVIATTGYTPKYSKMSFASRLNLASKYFEEEPSFPQIPDGEAWTASEKIYMDILKRTNSHAFGQSLGAIVNDYLALGISKRSTTAILDSLMVSFGGAPFIVGELPTDPNADYSELLAENKKETMNILKTCLTRYQNPNLTNDQIQKSLCGIKNPHN